MADYLTEVIVREDSPFVGRTVREAITEEEFEFDLVQLVRDGEVFGEPLAQKTIRPDDVLVVRTGRDTVVDLLDVEGIDLLPHVAFTDADLAVGEGSDRRDGRGVEQDLVEVMVPPDSSLVGETLASASFRDRYDATMLALRRGPTVLHRRMDHVGLRGDTMLVQASRAPSSDWARTVTSSSEARSPARSTAARSSRSRSRSSPRSSRSPPSRST